LIIWPVMNEPSSDISNELTDAISFGRPARLMDPWVSIQPLRAYTILGSQRSCMINPGATELALTPAGPYLAATWRINA
jgi:hypothetical protein